MWNWLSRLVRLGRPVSTPARPKGRDLSKRLLATADAPVAHGLELRKAGRFQEAFDAFDLALSTALDPATVHLEIANTHLDVPDLAAALDALQVAVTLNPNLGEAWMQLGVVLGRLDRDEEAVQAFREASNKVPHEMRAEALVQLANCLHACRRDAEAQQVVESALATEGGAADWRLHALIGHIHMSLERDELALAAYGYAFEICPSPTVELLLQLGAAQKHVGNWSDAQATFEAVLERQPSHAMARWYLCQCDLVQARWDRGWQGYASRFAAGASPFRALPFPEWDGRESKDSTLLILADQGLGDEIMFASCLPDAIRRVGRCIIECEPRLENLFRRSFPQAIVVGSQRDARAEWLHGLPKPNWQIFGGDLPVLFRRTEASFGAGSPYLQAEPSRVEFWKSRLRADWGDRPKLGISWRGGLPNTRMKSRSMTVDAWQPILGNPSCVFVNLQYGDSASERSELNARYSGVVQHYPEALLDYDETAALVAALDGVVTVCTAIVHLAGALGRPVWVLVPFVPGFRYTVGRTSLPWYGSSRMFRQTSPGDWEAPCTRVAEEIRKLTKSVTP